MEALYAKLYNKYTTLKVSFLILISDSDFEFTKKTLFFPFQERIFSELDEVNLNQEEKFLRFVKGTTLRKSLPLASSVSSLTTFFSLVKLELLIS